MVQRVCYGEPVLCAGKVAKKLPPERDLKKGIALTRNEAHTAEAPQEWKFSLRTWKIDTLVLGMGC
jgi:hypothetical protein